MTLKVTGKPNGASVQLTVTAIDGATGDEFDSAAKSVQAEQPTGTESTGSRSGEHRRIKGTQFRAKFFDADGRYTVKVDDKSIKGVKPGDGTLDVSF